MLIWLIKHGNYKNTKKGEEILQNVTKAGKPTLFFCYMGRPVTRKAGLEVRVSVPESDAKYPSKHAPNLKFRDDVFSKPCEFVLVNYLHLAYLTLVAQPVYVVQVIEMSGLLFICANSICKKLRQQQGEVQFEETVQCVHQSNSNSLCFFKWSVLIMIKMSVFKIFCISSDTQKYW